MVWLFQLLSDGLSLCSWFSWVDRTNCIQLLYGSRPAWLEQAISVMDQWTSLSVPFIVNGYPDDMAMVHISMSHMISIWLTYWSWSTSGNPLCHWFLKEFLAAGSCLLWPSWLLCHYLRDPRSVDPKNDTWLGGARWGAAFSRRERVSFLRNQSRSQLQSGRWRSLQPQSNLMKHCVISVLTYL